MKVITKFLRAGDRRGLSTVPALSGEERVRLLSLQHNLICRLEGFPALPRLVFLDLYDNQVERLSGLGALTNLRVLLLGKNRSVLESKFITRTVFIINTFLASWSQL